jgi:hypothetical protein
VKWLCATTAPWALAVGLLVSFTAAANNDPKAGVSAADRVAARLIGGTDLVPAVAASPADLGWLRPGAPAPLVGAGFDAERPGADAPLPPRADRKAEAPADPAVDRTRKGDPAGALLPTLSRRAGELRDRLGGPASRLVLTRDERLLPPTILMEGRVEGPDPEDQGFEPWISPDLTTTRQTSSVQSPAAAAAGSTGAAASTTTPAVSRAVALSSTTPAPADMTPVEIAAAPVSPRLDRGLGGDPPVGRPDGERPRYADLITPDNADKEQRCLAEAIYFEARSESEEGRAAVAQVVLNRAKSGLYPGSICGVVYQNRHRHLACQFTFACEGKALRITDRDSWSSARRIASAVLEGRTYLADVGGATHYHADYVKPYWARRLKKMDVIGRHIFYKLRPGQT